MSRKTIPVADIKDRINKYLATILSHDAKQGFVVLLESILHDTGNYQGFEYLFDYNAVSEDERNRRQFDRRYH